MTRSFAVLACSLCFLSMSQLSAADGPIDFARDIQPIFAKYCLKCHGSEKQEAGLRLDAPAAVARGGDRGPLLVARNVDASLLMQVVTGKDEDIGKMPPEGPAPSDADIALLARWIATGAELPQDPGGESLRADHWSFQPATRPQLPAVTDAAWVRNAIDYFILARLEREGLRPSPPADRATLIRRVSLDLLGIPPTPAEVEAFVNDARPDAYQRLLDRLFASPAYGERWGRHWLDLARYADSNGYTRDFAREIWKYRDWVINAVNADVPFDQFTVEQFAGDLLPDPTLDQRVATGFHRNTLINEEGGTDQEQFRVDAVADRVATTGVVYLGLTLECARCHSHKYDPISQREYYQLFAFLNNCDEPKLEAPADWQVARGDLRQRDQIRQAIGELEKQLEGKQAEFDAQQTAWEAAITPEFRVTLPGPVQEALMVPLAKRDDAQKKLVEDLYKDSDEARQAFPLLEEIKQLQASAPKIPTTMVLAERSEKRETHVHLRGNFLDPGELVRPAVPAVLPGLADELDDPGRLDFARWLVDPANPLTPRVVVNRYWQRFFGRGIVETENDFGTQGTPPSHPRLLDWLACEFVERGWSVKAIQRLIVNSATYRQSSHVRGELAAVDPYNILFARQSRLRLEAETVRDVALAAGGLLARKIGGPSVHPPQPEGVFAFTQDPKPWPDELGEDRYRRGMYTYFWRSSPYPALVVFDAPNANVTCTRRVRSNTPLQALTLANDTQFVEAARGLARRVVGEGSAELDRQIDYVCRVCLARSPSDAERERLRELFELQRDTFQNDKSAAAALMGAESGDELVELAAWTSVARVLMNVDEFITRE